jgi:hypothetical protein
VGRGNASEKVAYAAGSCTIWQSGQSLRHTRASADFKGSRSTLRSPQPRRRAPDLLVQDGYVTDDTSVPAHAVQASKRGRRRPPSPRLWLARSREWVRFITFPWLVTPGLPPLEAPQRRHAPSIARSVPAERVLSDQGAPDDTAGPTSNPRLLPDHPSANRRAAVLTGIALNPQLHNAEITPGR